MRLLFPCLMTACLLVGESRDLIALESPAEVRPGIRSIRLLTDVSAIVPGKTITVGLLLDPLPGHHTYWRGPGIVGVATQLDWKLPEGFKAGPLLWPPPTKVIMAGILANGFKSPVLLLTDIQTPPSLDVEEVVISARASWMSCSATCNPGFADLAITIPVSNEGKETTHDPSIAARFEEARLNAPKPAPSTWTFTPRLVAPDRIELDFIVPGFHPDDTSTVLFHCDDMQVDSDEAQTLMPLDPAKGAYRLLLARPEFAPKSPKSISGVLHCPAGWPGIGSAYLDISAPWPSGTFPE